MKFYIFLLLCLFLCVSGVSATDKIIRIIPNCYNGSVSVTLLQGHYSPISFDNAINDYGSHWIFDCHDYSYPFVVKFNTMDNTALDSSNWRFYRFDLNYYTYNLLGNNGSLIFTDYGNSIISKGDSINQYDPTIIIEPHYIYINRTIFIDRNITQFIEVNHSIFVNQTFEHNITNIIENFSRVNSLEHDINIKYYWIYFLCFCIVILFIWNVDLKRKI